MVRKALMNSKHATQMKVKCDTMLPTMMKALMTVEFLRKMYHSHQM
jgi:hypothetical protein